MTTPDTLPWITTIEDTLDWPARDWKNNCHDVSLRAVRSGLFGEPGPSCRVVRGWAPGYGIEGQHSWIALGRPFDPATRILDLTAHRWGRVDGIVDSTVGEAYQEACDGFPGHVLHGYRPRSIWNYGKPDPVGGPGDLIELERDGLSEMANAFLDVLGPMTDRAWRDLVTFPHDGWPAHEICEAIVEQIPRVKIMLPIDVLAHVTDRNPEGLYW